MKMINALFFGCLLAIGTVVVAPGQSQAQHEQFPPPSLCSSEPAHCICPHVWEPVCGMDGKTYGNDCEADCACMPVAYTGECEPKCTELCAKTRHFPVCGDDGETYGNECYAKCWGATPVHKGECGPIIVPPPQPIPGPVLPLE